MHATTAAKGGARCGSLLFESDDYRKIRLTYFDAGAKVQCFNALWYPRLERGDAAPLLGLDLLCFGGGKKILAVVDAQPLAAPGDAAARARYVDPLVAVKAQHPALQGQMSDRF